MDAYENRTEYAADAVEAPPAPAGPPVAAPAAAETDLTGRPIQTVLVPGAAAPARAVAPAAPVTPVETVTPAPAARRVARSTYVTGSFPVAFRARQLIWLVYAVVAAFLVLDLVFRAAGASSASAFATFVFNVGGALNAPFRGIFAPGRGGQATVEWADIIALAVYALAAWVAERLVLITRTSPPGPYPPV